VVSQLRSIHRTTQRLHPPLGGCYSVGAVGSGVCREAGDGACVGYAEENKTDRTPARVRVASAEETCPKATDDSTEEQGKCKSTKCDVMIGGNSYCSQCSLETDHLVDGKCVATDAANACIAKTSAADGTCRSCAQGYFLHRGGCYKAGAFPGNAICTTATGGSCTMCVSSGADPKGQSCPACPAGCSKCSGSGSSQTCSECLAGYYKTSANTCVKCDKDDSNIKGVPNCVSCAPPTTPPGPVTCYVTQEPTVDPTDPSVNKGGLPSGTIAGISVAVIVVVGGLVGFLCWWFVCYR
ncbi:Variant-specific surface protein, partial [Giardia duodenalis]